MKFFFGFLAFIAAVVVVVLLVLGFIRTTNSNAVQSAVSATATLTDDDMVSSVVRYTVTSPVVADENYRETRMTVSQTGRTIEVLKGYDKKVEKSSTLPNSKEAYKAFLGALAAAHFSAKRDNVQGSARTTCVTGNHYFYELSLGSDKKVDTWTTSCSSKNGSFAGEADNTAQLFRDQFPDYDKTTSGSERGVYNLAPL